MKNLFFAFVLLLLSGCAFGQARDGTADLKKTGFSENAVLIYLPYSSDVVKQALQDFVLKASKNKNRDTVSFKLASNTELAEKNIKNADMHFEIGNKDNLHPNESVVYLKLRSSVETNNGTGETDFLFDKQQAIDFLNNFAIAIKPYATDMQLQFQKDNLAYAEKRNDVLIKQGNKLEKRKSASNLLTTDNLTNRASGNRAKRERHNQQLIDENLTAQASQRIEIDNQKSSLHLLLIPAQLL